ncbi:hypothetical protein IMCC20628_00759 [Hoeflea sp. IMCC20628]|uniref:c-type cytochrome n=1 Tax=Hoeflea sp. IMCC20628 TaxID=1620421 RepID=UPI00063A8821|nr:hypothetical protein [Hoeflea sp. IMCC20628]AKH99480.1 hypothetical protein IMCC20628_00759 [Hoeflea sp. IMCC20628]
MLRLLIAGLTLILPVSTALADKAAVARGQAVVDEWCRDCHVPDGQNPDADMAPPYADLVNIEGRDRAWFEAFLEADHFPMTTFRLFDHEKADVVAYLLSLQQK